MKNKIFTATLALTCCAGMVFSSIKDELYLLEKQINLIQSEFNPSGSGSARIDTAIKALNSIEKKVLKEIASYQAKLQKYKEEIENEHKDEVLKKIASAEKKIRSLNESLVTIQSLRGKMNG